MPLPSDQDDSLLEELAEALRPPPEVPAAWLDAAKAAWTWRLVDEELAALTYDSTLDAAAVRGADTATRTLQFEGPGVHVSVELDGDTLRGQLVPVRSASVTVERADRTTPVTIQDLGHGAFTATGLGDGPLRLRIVDDGQQQPVLTSWFRVSAGG
jgi:hypothetical protein